MTFVRRATQLTGHWQRMVRKGHLEGNEFQQYWENKRQKTHRYHEGPIHLFAKLMNNIGIEIGATHKWKVEGKWIHIEEIENLKQLFRENPNTECGCN